MGNVLYKKTPGLPYGDYFIIMTIWPSNLLINSIPSLQVTSSWEIHPLQLTHPNCSGAVSTYSTAPLDSDASASVKSNGRTFANSKGKVEGSMPVLQGAEYLQNSRFQNIVTIQISHLEGSTMEF